jgi:hypothetical protein
MAIDTSKIDLMGGLDEVVMNQRVRGYVPGNPTAASAPGAQQYGTMWMQGTGVATNFAAGTTPSTITAAMLGGGIIVQTPSGVTVWNLDTAANIIAYMNSNSAGVQVGDILVCDVINASTTTTNTITINFGTGGGFDTGQTQLVMNGGTSRTLFIRITNLTNPAYICYG